MKCFSQLVRVHIKWKIVIRALLVFLPLYDGILFVSVCMCVLQIDSYATKQKLATETV